MLAVVERLYAAPILCGARGDLALSTQPPSYVELVETSRWRVAYYAYCILQVDNRQYTTLTQQHHNIDDDMADGGGDMKV